MSDRLAVSYKDGAKMVGLSRSKMYELNSSGKLGPTVMKVGTRSLISVRELEFWVNWDYCNRVTFQEKLKQLTEEKEKLCKSRQ